MALSGFFMGLWLLSPDVQAQEPPVEHGHHSEEVPPMDPGPSDDHLVGDLEPGVLVLASDRGFLGNEEIRDLVSEFASRTDADVELVLVTGVQTEGRIDEAVMALQRGGNGRTLILPLFLSDDHPRFVLAQQMLSQHDGIECASVFGESYSAVDLLVERLSSLSRSPPLKKNA